MTNEEFTKLTATTFELATHLKHSTCSFTRALAAKAIELTKVASEQRGSPTMPVSSNENYLLRSAVEVEVVYPPRVDLGPGLEMQFDAAGTVKMIEGRVVKALLLGYGQKKGDTVAIVKFNESNTINLVPMDYLAL